MDFADPAQRAAFFAVHNDMPREGPGDRASAAKALQLAGPLSAQPDVLDIACGPGGQTLDLADLLPGARITALDGHGPFLRQLEARATEAGVLDRITLVHGDMARLPYAPQSFDLIWCEGAAYIVGLGAALAAWKPLLRPGGVLALTEPVWLTSDPPRSVRACWEAYPAMEDVASARRRAVEHGYEIAGDFVLSDAAWWTHYYGPLEARLEAATARLAGDPTAAVVLAEIRDEIECRRAHPEDYGYLFLVLRA
jgi:ubiquinone/menaquinone biosynthesis C-methylase UbiE